MDYITEKRSHLASKADLANVKTDKMVCRFVYHIGFNGNWVIF